MERNWLLAWAVFLLLLTLAQGTVLARGDVIRLHVIANSDSSEDQKLKEEVRDELIKQLSPILSTMNQQEGAAWLLANKTFLTDTAIAVLGESGEDYPLQIRFTVEDYPVRVYRREVFPQGKYRSVQVIIGAGEGRNWWCLLFPPLCLVKEAVIEAEEAEETGVQEDQVRFWFWDFLKKIFGL